MALGTFLAGCLLGALAATFLTHAEQHSFGSDSVPLSLSDAFAQIQSGWTRPTQALCRTAAARDARPFSLGPARAHSLACNARATQAPLLP